VWLNICVRSELGLVKRLSHILHRCFFCALDDTFELNCPIIVCGAGGSPPAPAAEGDDMAAAADTAVAARANGRGGSGGSNVSDVELYPLADESTEPLP
jgi:hypothetical protein